MSRPKTQEEIYERINKIKDDIFDLREQINSAQCRHCSSLYDKMMILEQELKGYQRELLKYGNQS